MPESIAAAWLELLETLARIEYELNISISCGHGCTVEELREQIAFARQRAHAAIANIKTHGEQVQSCGRCRKPMPRGNCPLCPDCLATEIEEAQGHAEFLYEFAPAGI